MREFGIEGRKKMGMLGFIGLSPGQCRVEKRQRGVCVSRRCGNVAMGMGVSDRPVAAAPSAQRVSWAQSARAILYLAHRVARRSRKARGENEGLMRLAKASVILPIMLATVTSGPTATATLPSGPWRAFTSAFGVAFVSQFGDKSMFATALMAMRYNPIIVLLGALIALTGMTVIACFLGQLGQFLHPSVTQYMSVALFAYFGVQMLLSARHLSSTPGGAGGEAESAKEMIDALKNTDARQKRAILVKVLSLIFVAEWLDRSMIAVMALAAAGNTAVVFLGASTANIVCTGIAVSGASIVATRISERTVAIIAGIIFEFFAVYTLFEGSESE